MNFERYFEYSNERLFRLLIASLILLVIVTPYKVNGLENSIGNPVGLHRAYGDYVFAYTNGNASGGSSEISEINELGYFSPRVVRVNTASNLLDGVEDPSTLEFGTTYRYFITDQAGNVAYTTAATVNYSLGFYSCCDVYGNPTNTNPLYRIGTLSATTLPRKIAIDTSGNIYTSDGLIIKKYIKSLSYAVSNFYAVTDDGQPGISRYILDFDFDESGNLHILTGDATVNVGGDPQPAYLIKWNVNPAGSLVSSVTIETTTVTPTAADRGFKMGSMVLDSTSSNTNFTYVFSRKDLTNVYIYIFHNSTNGTIDIGGGALVGVSSVGSMEYYNSQYYVTFPTYNLIRSYTSAFIGLFIEPGSFATQEIAYDVSSVQSLYSKYNNNSPINIQYQISFQISETDYNLKKDILYWRIDILDPNFSKIANANIVMPCQYNGFMTYTYTCQRFSSVLFSPTTTWIEGNYTAKLYENNISSGTNALLDSDSYEVLNYSGQLVSTNPNANIDPNSPTSSTDIISLLQKNIFWALIITVGMMLGVGAMARKSDVSAIMPMAMVGFMGLAIFSYIGWLPLWIVIGVVLIAAVTFAWSQASKTNTGGAG